MLNKLKELFTRRTGLFNLAKGIYLLRVNGTTERKSARDLAEKTLNVIIEIPAGYIIKEIVVEKKS